MLGRNVAVSANCVLLRGTRIGENAVVAAGAVVNGGEYPADWLIGGLPARALRALGGVDGHREEAPRWSWITRPSDQEELWAWTLPIS